MFTFVPGKAEGGGQKIRVVRDPAGMAPHEEIAALDRLGEHLEKFDGPRPADSSAAGLGPEDGLGEDGPQPLLGEGAGIEFVEDFRRVPVASQDPTDAFEEGNHPRAAIPSLEGAFDGRRDLDDVEGFGQVVKDTVADPLDGGLDRTAARDDDDLGLRKFRAIRLALGRVFQTLRQRRWRGSDELPEWVRKALENDDVLAPGGALRGSPVGAFGLRGAPKFETGWVVVRGGAPVFLFRRGPLPVRRKTAVRIDLGAFEASAILEENLFRRVDLAIEGASACLLFGVGGPSAESLRAEFLFT